MSQDSRRGWKRRIAPFLFLIPLTAATGHPATRSASQSDSDFTVHRGTNVSHWLSQSRRRGEERKAFFTRRDVEFLARLGFDHLRIPVDEEQLWDEAGAPDEEAFGLLDDALDWCREFGLKAIVDLHILRSHHFDSVRRPLWSEAEAQERFLKCWRDLSARLRDRPTSLLAYELMNEPVAPDPEDWNRLLGKAVRVIRELEPERTLVIGSNRWQSVETFDRLEVPPGDRRLLLSFHFYIPFPFTHYRASWNKVGEYSGPVRYPGVVVADEDLRGLPADLVASIGEPRQFDRGKLEQLLSKPLALSRSTGLPLYCGEWGALPTSPRPDRLRWYADVRSIFESHGIGWATWDYKGSFGLVGKDGAPDDELIATLGLHRQRTGRVVSPTGEPLPGVRVCSTTWLCSLTDEEGHFIHDPQLAPPTVVHFSRRGFRPVSRVVDKSDWPIRIVLEPAEDAVRTVPSCVNPPRWPDWQGGRLRVTIPDGVEMVRSDDVDYSSGIVRYSETEALRVGGGPTWSTGLPAARLLEASSEVFERELDLPGAPASPAPSTAIEGVDVRGVHVDGKRWRFTGDAFQTFSYEQASPEAAAFFDRLLETLCQADTIE